MSSTIALRTDPRHGLTLVLQKGLQRWLTRSSMDEIMPGLFLGGSYAAENLATQNPHGIAFVLSVHSRDVAPGTREQYARGGIEHLHVRKRDERDENLLEVFGELCGRIEERLQGGKKVLVHCVMGISRSVTIVCAYIMQRYGLSRSEAKEMVKAKRYVANPNSGFYTQLRVWEKCRYDIRSAISVNGVKPYKAEYSEWLDETKMEMDGQANEDGGRA